MSTYKKSKAIVLSTDDISESDRGFTIFTQDYGKLFVIARGARKIQSKLNAHMQPFSVTDVMFAQGKQMKHLVDSCLQEDFSLIKESLSEIALGSYCLEMVESFLPDEQYDPQVYDLLRELLSILNRPEEKKFTKSYQTKEILITKLFAIKLLQILGFQPHVDDCVECGAEIKPEHIFFDPERGVLCSVCGTQQAHYLRISENALKVLRLALKMPLSEMMHIMCKRSLVLELNNIVDTYVKQYLEAELKSDVWLSGLLK